MKTLETYEERKAFVEELRQQWKNLWLERIDDEVRAEGISNKDYFELFIERGTVIVATRKFKPPDFHEIVQKHLSSNQNEFNDTFPLNPKTGGWGKFIRNAINRQNSAKTRRRYKFDETEKKAGQQLKKCGRGWLHFRKGQA